MSIFFKTQLIIYVIFCWSLALAGHSSLTSPNSSTQKHDLSATDLEAFFDGFIPLQIGEADVAGAVIAVVKDNQVLFSKGYGYVNVKEKTPISPESTLFRAGSISKLFLWTAIMQLVEQEKLDLDRDINDYLDFKIPTAFDKPITMRDIMTHRTGFEESLKGLFVDSMESLNPISHYVKTHIPARIFPPGTIPAYSNYASTLAAYILERISGQEFNAYIEEHIFTPLSMAHSTFRQPLPDSLKPSVSNGYILGSGDPQPFELIQSAPAGALSASAMDMTHFMIMHLQNGRYEDRSILKPETAIKMHARQEGWPPEMNAMCLGFYEQSENGYRVIAHGGDTIQFHSNLLLLIDANIDAKVGLFICYNSIGKSVINLRSTLFTNFMDRYFPESQLPKFERQPSVREMESISGYYESSRRSETTFLSMLTLFGEAKVALNPDQTISMTGFNRLNQQPVHFGEIGPMLFRDVEGKAKLSFVDDAQGGRIAYIDYPFMVYQQVNHLVNMASFNYWILGFSLTVVIVTLLGWPISSMVRRHYGKTLELSAGKKTLRFLVRIACLFIILYLIGLLIFITGLKDPSSLSDRMDGKLRTLQLVGLLIGIGSLMAIFNSLLSWMDKNQWIWTKIWNTALAAACLGIFWFIYHWNLLTLNLNY